MLMPPIDAAVATCRANPANVLMPCRLTGDVVTSHVSDVGFDPSWVKLFMLGGLVDLQMPVEESVRSMVALLVAATPETLNGRFVDWKGDDMPW